MLNQFPLPVRRQGETRLFTPLLMPQTRETLIRLHTACAAGVFRFLRSLGLDEPAEQGSVGNLHTGDRVRLDGNVVTLYAGDSYPSYQGSMPPAPDGYAPNNAYAPNNDSYGPNDAYAPSDGYAPDERTPASRDRYRSGRSCAHRVRNP